VNLPTRILALILLIVLFTRSHAQDIYLACYNGDLETVKRMVNENPDLVNSRNSDGRFPLEMAAQTGQTEICLFLLEKGANVNMNRRGATALHMAALYGGKTALILLLLDKGADINARTGNGHTPLNLAVIGKQKEIANLLLDRGGEINLENQNITELLSISAAGGIDRIVALARKNEIDFSFQTMTGSTLLHSAAEGGITELAGWLLSKGLDVGAADIYGVTPLHLAAASGKREMVELLLNKGANINAKTKNGKTPIHLATERGHEDVVAYLRKNGADTAEWRFPELTGKYLDQPPPGETAEIFAPGIVSAQEYFEHSCLAFSPDYSEIYWSTDFTESGFYDIVYMKKEKGRWSAPKLAPFSEKNHAGSPVFSYDGRKLYFSSTRPRSENAGNNDENIWVVERIGEGWSEPKPLGEPVNTEQNESIMSISRQGAIYFRRDMEFFRSGYKNGFFEIPEKLDIQISKEMRILAIFVAPAEDYMILESFGGGGFGGADLLICYKLNVGSWSECVNIGSKINSGGHERFPSVTPDGKYLFFCRVLDGSDFYWADAKIIEHLKPEALK
jgi:ankyrin repeat protein